MQENCVMASFRLGYIAQFCPLTADEQHLQRSKGQDTWLGKEMTPLSPCGTHLSLAINISTRLPHCIVHANKRVILNDPLPKHPTQMPTRNSKYKYNTLCTLHSTSHTDPSTPWKRSHLLLSSFCVTLCNGHTWYL